MEEAQELHSGVGISFIISTIPDTESVRTRTMGSCGFHGVSRGRTGRPQPVG